MSGKLTLLMTTFILLLMSPGFGQTCGDADGNTLTDIGDLVYVFSYITGQGPAPIDSASTEWDDHSGITISDVVALSQYIFFGGPLACGATQMYSFASSVNDTVFMPRIYNIPDGLDRVQLPISFSFDTNTVAFCLPVLPLGGGPDTLFEFDSIQSHSVTGMTRRIWANGDTAVLAGFETPGNEILRQGDAFTLYFSRVGDGVAYIETELIDLAGARKWAVSKGDGDLYRPVIVTVDIPTPPDTLTVSETDISFQTMAGNQSLDSFYVDFGSTGTPVQFGLVTSDVWILIDAPLMPELLTTPTTVLVTVDSDQMPIGTHSGRIDIIPQDSTVITVGDLINATHIDVTLTVYDPNLYPNGDLDCNGIIDLGDLTLMIAYLFLGGPAPQPCQ